jgi:hypothetical protein
MATSANPNRTIAARTCHAAFVAAVVPLLLVGAGVAPAFADPGMTPTTPVPSPADPALEQIDDLLDSPGGAPARGGVQMPGVQIFGPQFPVPPVEAFPGTTGIPVPGICVPGMPCPVIPLPQIDIDYGSPGLTPGH